MLVDLVQNGRRDEAGSAIWSLARTGAPEARDALLAAMTGSDTQVAAYAVSAAGQMLGDPEVAGALARAARGATDPNVKTSALGQLLQNRMPEGMRLAEEIVRGGRPDEASQAIQMLSSLGTADALSLVREATRQSDAQVRATAAGSLAMTPDAASSQLLFELSKDRDPKVRSAALGGLGQIGSAEAVGALIEAARAGETTDRQAAIQALGSTDDPRSAATIIQLIGAGDPDVATSAISASYNGGREVDQALVAVLRSENPHIRTAAAYQLRSRGSRLGPELERLVESIIGAR